ncbi:MAG TPA: O-antigen ligase family protein [Anaeromyxobacteraceae bacterium]|nr:O-antigen ligase family protein [Anaeromyxobacteraceae bacterium]
MHASSLPRALLATAGALRRQRRAAGAAGAVAAAVAALALALTPATWHSDAELLAQRAPVMPALGHPGRTVPPEADAPTRAAAEHVLSHENLLALVQETDLAGSFRRSRSPLGRLRDAAAALLGRRRTERDEVEGLVYLLQRRLYVVPGPQTVTIGIDWPDGPSAHRLVRAAQRRFLEERRAQELSLISDTIAILDRRAAAAEGETHAAFEALRGAVAGQGTGAGPELPRARRASLPRDPEIGRLRTLLSSRQAQLERLEAAQRSQLAEAEDRLAELTAVFSEGYPDVQSLRSSIASLAQEPAAAQALHAEIAALRGEVARRSLALRAARAQAAQVAKPVSSRTAPRPRSPSDPEAPAVHYARDRLRSAALVDATLAQRMVDTNVELDVASAAFKYRYAVIRPATLPREPIGPTRPLLLGAAFLCTLAASLLAAFAAEAGAGAAAGPRSNGRWPSLRTLGAAAVLTFATMVILAQAAAPLAPPAPPRWPDGPAWALLPAALAGIGWATWKLPIRRTALPLMFLMLALEARGSAGGKWASPWAPVGYLLNSNLNLSIPVRALRFSGVDALLLAMSGVILWRLLSGSRLDSEGAVRTPWPLHLAALASTATLLLLVGHGLARGGDLQQTLWQVHQLGFLPVVFFVLLAAIRGPQDFPALGKVFVIAALLKAVLASYVRGAVEVAAPTTHADSMLFVAAACVMLALVLEHRTPRTLGWCLLVVPLVAFGIKMNNRRLAWVELAAAVVVMYALCPATRLKRALTRGALLLLPVFALYLAAGWNAHSSFFGPAVKVRTLLDPKYDRSNEEREVENYNLVSNLRERPVLGTGFGHPYQLFVQPDDISYIFPQWQFIPHNSVLGLLAFGGIAGFTGLWLVLPVTVFFAARAYRRSRVPMHRAAALSAVAAVLVYLLQCFGDMGLVEWHGIFLVASAMVVAARLPATCGAWPAPRTSRGPQGGAPSAG